MSRDQEAPEMPPRGPSPVPRIAWLDPVRSDTSIVNDHGVAPPSTIRFCEATATQFPELGRLLVEHRGDNEAETLGHVFMGDVARWFMDRWRADDRGSARALAEWLDDQYPALDGDSRNVIDVSFLENLPWPPDPEAGADRLLGPELRQRLVEMQNSRPSAPSGDIPGH